MAQDNDVSGVSILEWSSRWLALFGWGAIIALGRLGYVSADGFHHPIWLCVAIGVATGSILGIPLIRIWWTWRKLLPYLVEEDRKRKERRDLATRERAVELLEREKAVRELEKQLAAEREQAIADLQEMREDLSDE